MESKSVMGWIVTIGILLLLNVIDKIQEENLLLALMIGAVIIFLVGIGVVVDFLKNTKTRETWEWIQTLIIPVVGGLSTGYFSIGLFGSMSMQKMVLDNFFDMLGSLWILCAIAFNLSIYMKRKSMEKKYCVVEIGKCVKHDCQVGIATKGLIKRVYAPVFTYSYKKKYYHRTANSYSAFGMPKVGSKVVIGINPDNPNDIYWHNSVQHLWAYAQGSIFVLFGVFIMSVV